MIYIANRFGAEPDYYVEDQATADLLQQYYSYSSLQIGTRTDAELQLDVNRQTCLTENADRFNICAIFVNGSDTVWRAMRDDDPEEYEYKVFNHMTGVYSTHQTKTAALIENEIRKDEFLTMFGMDSVKEWAEVPVPPVPEPVDPSNII